MSHPSKTKGSNFEREIVNLVKSLPGWDARRAYASNGEALGQCKECDLVINQLTYEPFEAKSLRVQAKRRKSLPAYLQIPAGCDAVVVRQDRGEAVIILRLTDYLESL